MAQRRRTVTGTVVSIKYPGFGAKPAVVVSLDVDSSIVQLIFLGRRDLKSLDIGQTIEIKGSVVRRRGVPTIYNPKYRIEPEDI